MKVIWHSNYPISTGEVRKLIDIETDNVWTQQTIQSLLNRLIAKGYLEKGKKGKEYIYTPIIAERDYIEYESRRFLKKIHGNSVVGLMKALFNSNQISESDVLELEKMFKEKRK